MGGGGVEGNIKQRKEEEKKNLLSTDLIHNRLLGAICGVPQIHSTSRPTSYPCPPPSIFDYIFISPILFYYYFLG